MGCSSSKNPDINNEPSSTEPASDGKTLTEDEAATKIQAAYKGHAVRAEKKKEENAATTIQVRRIPMALE